MKSFPLAWMTQRSTLGPRTPPSCVNNGKDVLLRGLLQSIDHMLVLLEFHPKVFGSRLSLSV